MKPARFKVPTPTVEPKAGDVMRQNSFSANVFAPVETLWGLVLKRVEHPNEYLPGIEEVRIIEHRENILIRELRGNGLFIKERVTVDKMKREIRYLLLEHPLFSGTVTHRVVPLSRQSPVAPVHLSMVANWVPKNEEAEGLIVKMMSTAIQQEIFSIKAEAEGLGK
jgi:hypothetical protein